VTRLPPRNQRQWEHEETIDDVRHSLMYWTATLREWQMLGENPVIIQVRMAMRARIEHLKQRLTVIDHETTQKALTE
jgi:hypothetical protein